MPTTMKELTGHDEIEFEKLDSEIRGRLSAMKPRLDELAALAVRMRESRLYLAKYQTYDEYALATFGRTAKAMEALVYRERKKAKQIAPSKRPAETREVSTTNCEYVGTENVREEKPMATARRIPGADHGQTTPPPPPQVVIKTPVVPLNVTERVNDIVREAMKLANSGPIAFTEPSFRHLLSQLLGLQKLVQPSLPGMDEHFAKTQVLPSPARKGRCSETEAVTYCRSLGLPDTDGEWFFAKMEGAGWKNGGKSVADWQQTIRAWKLGGYMASQKRSNGHSPKCEQPSAFTLKTQLDAIESKIKRIRQRGVEGPFGIKLDDVDKPEYRSLCDKKKELVNRLASLT